MLAAAVAYRVAGVDGRATRRAVEGIAATRDFQRVLDAPGQGACLAEFVADFRVAGGLDGADSAYDDAAALAALVAGGVFRVYFRRQLKANVARVGGEGVSAP